MRAVVRGQEAKWVEKEVRRMKMEGEEKKCGEFEVGLYVVK